MATDTTPSPASAGQRKRADKNKDGLLSQKEVDSWNKSNPGDLIQDSYSAESAQAKYQMQAAVINSDPKLQQLFMQAVNNQWESARFEAALLNWAQGIGLDTKTALDAYKTEHAGGEQWVRAQEKALGEIRESALELGIDVGDIDPTSEAGQKVVRDWVYGGYANRPKAARVAFLEPGRGVQGDSGNLGSYVQQVRQAAAANGITKSEDWFRQVAESMSSGKSDANTWLNDIYESAAAKFPLYADRIKAGISVKELASDYMYSMRELLGVTEPNLDDPYLVKALGGKDDKGVAKAMNLADFQDMLRQDPRWENTTNGKNTLLNASSDFLRSMGFVD